MAGDGRHGCPLVSLPTTPAPPPPLPITTTHTLGMRLQSSDSLVYPYWLRGSNKVKVLESVGAAVGPNPRLLPPTHSHRHIYRHAHTFLGPVDSQKALTHLQSSSVQVLGALGDRHTPGSQTNPPSLLFTIIIWTIASPHPWRPCHILYHHTESALFQSNRHCQYLHCPETQSPSTKQSQTVS